MRNATPLALLGLALLLSGCSVAYEAPGAPAADPTPLAASPSSVASTPPPAVSADPGPDPRPTASGADLRETYADAAQQTSCASGEVTVSQAGAVVEITGDCALVRIQASGAVVLAGAVASLEITGAANQVQVAALDAVQLGGSGNDVRWESGAPEVTDIGAANSARATTGG